MKGVFLSFFEKFTFGKDTFYKIIFKHASMCTLGHLPL